jgi:pyruvate dehydrogenase E1 component alpha subunit
MSKVTDVKNVAVPVGNYDKSATNAKLDKAEKIKILTDMIRIRRFEDRCNEAYQGGNIGGFLHLYNGQEAIAVGATSVCGKHDHQITAYRDHGHALAVGMSMNECMAELYGKATGCSKGKGGSMHFFAPDKNYWGGHGIVGGQTPLGLGLGYGIKFKGLKGAALCYLGDGAVNQGAFHESLNIASLWNIPVIYIIENNGYSMGTSLSRSSAFTGCLAKRAEGYAMDWKQCMGHDVYEVRSVIQEAMDRAHDKCRPTLLEISTYRYRGHSVADSKHDKGYRSKEEIEEYKRTKDPINLFKMKLIADGTINDVAYEKIDLDARNEAEAAAQFAEESPYPTVESIREDVYWETDQPDGRTSHGRIFFNDEIE